MKLYKNITIVVILIIGTVFSSIIFSSSKMELSANKKDCNRYNGRLSKNHATCFYRDKYHNLVMIRYKYGHIRIRR